MSFSSCHLYSRSRSYSGVLGLGPSSPVWEWYDSWTLERAWLILGRGDAYNYAARNPLPPGVHVSPQLDYSFIRDMYVYNRWLTTMPDDTPYNKTEAQLAATLMAAAGGSRVDSSFAALLNRTYLSVSSRRSLKTGVQRSMVLHGKNTRIELEPTATDASTGHPMALVDFDGDRVSGPDILLVGMWHARDHNLAGNASDSTTALLSPSLSGATRADDADYVWLFIACVLLSILQMPGLYDRVHRLRWTREEDLDEEARKRVMEAYYDDWCLLHLVCRAVILATAWVAHASLAVYRGLQDFGPPGCHIAYYGCVAYVVVTALLAGSPRYASRISVTLYTVSLYICCWLMLAVRYEDSMNLFVMFALSGLAYYVSTDLALGMWAYPEERGAPRSYVGALLMTCAAVFFGWFFAFYTLDHYIAMHWPEHPMNRMIETCAAIFVFIFSVHLIMGEAAAKFNALSLHAAHLYVDKREKQQPQPVKDAEPSVTAVDLSIGAPIFATTLESV